MPSTTLRNPQRPSEPRVAAGLVPDGSGPAAAGGCTNIQPDDVKRAIRLVEAGIVDACRRAEGARQDNLPELEELCYEAVESLTDRLAMLETLLEQVEDEQLRVQS